MVNQTLDIESIKKGEFLVSDQFDDELEKKKRNVDALEGLGFDSTAARQEYEKCQQSLAEKMIEIANETECLDLFARLESQIAVLDSLLAFAVADDAMNDYLSEREVSSRLAAADTKVKIPHKFDFPEMKYISIFFSP